MKTISPVTSWRSSSSPNLNEAAVRAMVEGIINDPDSWEQNYWGFEGNCGTTYCAAGFTVLQDGWKINFTGSRRYRAFTCSKVIDGHKVSNTIRETAQSLLGLNECATNLIFSYTVNLDTGKHPTVEEFVQRIADVTGLEFKIPE